MRKFSLRPDLERVVIDGFALPLGFVPGTDGPIEPPTPGYTLDYTPGEEDEPDSYSFYVVASHERMEKIVDRCLGLLPQEVYGIIEIGSRDAYRALDVYLGSRPIPRERFRRGWKRYAAFLMEDGSIGAGANGDDPFVEIFIDQWKGLAVHVPLSMRATVEKLLAEHGLREVPQTWPPMDEDEANSVLRVRPVLAEDDDHAPGVDEMLYQLRRAWDLELDVDPDANLDEAGRELGLTLWHAMVIVDSVERSDEASYASVWATAASLREMEELTVEAVAALPDWRYADVYTIDRVAYDERPDELADLPPRRDASEVHLVVVET